MSMPTDEAVRLLANHLVAVSLECAIGAGIVEWEDYPEVGEYDWDKVVKRAREVVSGLRPTNEAFKAAYDVLKARAVVSGE